jgi:hypothetical protein
VKVKAGQGGVREVGFGVDDDVSQILPQWEQALELCVYLFTVLYHPDLVATKTAILILYYRLRVVHPFLRRSSLVTLAIFNCGGIVLTFLSIFQCRLISAAFADVHGTCLDKVSLYLASAPVDVLTDLAILLLLLRSSHHSE